MQNVDEILPVILHASILKRPPFFLFFEIKPYSLACNPIFGSFRGVQKELGKNRFFPPAWNKLYQSCLLYTSDAADE